MKVAIGGMTIHFVSDIVTNSLHLLVAHSLAKVGRDVARVGSFDDIREGGLIGPCQFALQGEDIMHEGVLEPSWGLAELDAFSGGSAGWGRSVGIGKLHSPLGQCGEMRSLVKVAGRVRIAFHHPDRGVCPAEVIDIDDDEVGRIVGCVRNASERGDQKQEEPRVLKHRGG